VTGAVITGVAAVGIGAGLVVLLSQASRNDAPSAIPDFDVRLSGQKAGATVRWRF
jgi:NAD(P)H-hydrate repair Nnr-like enzyme with NAD(P)H-hydrate dehydratase domain